MQPVAWFGAMRLLTFLGRENHGRLAFWLLLCVASTGPVRGLAPAVYVPEDCWSIQYMEGCLEYREVEGWLGSGLYSGIAAGESPRFLPVTPINSLVSCCILNVECFRPAPVFELDHQLVVVFWEVD